jgi:general secretion pathway protein G
MKGAAKQAGFTLIELLIVVSIVAFLASLLFSRVLFYQEMAEKAAMQQVVGALQSALVLQMGHRMAAGTGAELNNLVYENPMDWLAQKPGNYAGEFNTVNPALIEPGNWVFDKGRHELIYILDHVEYFVPAKNGVKWIRYHTRLVFETSNKNSKIQNELAGVMFAPVEPYQWLVREKL